MMLNYNFSKEFLTSIDKKLDILIHQIESQTFYQVLKNGYSSALKFIHENISDMRPEFIYSVNKGFIGYYLFYGEEVLFPNTINEILHYIHSYVINNENFYQAIPILKTNKLKDNTENNIILRGISNDLSNQLYEELIKINLNSEDINIISLQNKILIMARALGHAAVLEIELENDEEIYVSYFIPKNTNKEKVSQLKGINKNTDEFASGNFKTSKSQFVDDICTLLKNIPTDLDLLDIKFN